MTTELKSPQPSVNRLTAAQKRALTAILCGDEFKRGVRSGPVSLDFTCGAVGSQQRIRWNTVKVLKDRGLVCVERVTPQYDLRVVDVLRLTDEGTKVALRIVKGIQESGGRKNRPRAGWLKNSTQGKIVEVLGQLPSKQNMAMREIMERADLSHAQCKYALRQLRRRGDIVSTPEVRGRATGYRLSMPVEKALAALKKENGCR